MADPDGSMLGTVALTPALMSVTNLALAVSIAFCLTFSLVGIFPPLSNFLRTCMVYRLRVYVFAHIFFYMRHFF